MKRLLFSLLFAGLLSSASSGQVLKLLATDTFYGAGLGGLLWTGSAAIAGADNLSGLGGSIGAGILVGAGMGGYDSYLYLHNGNPYRNGSITSSGTSMQIVTMDALYGGAIGAMLGAAVGLISSDSGFLKSTGYGYGYGVWTGMIFGVVDAVVLAQPGKNSSAMIQYQGEGYTLSSFSPDVRMVMTQSATGPVVETVPMVNLVSVSF